MSKVCMLFGDNLAQYINGILYHTVAVTCKQNGFIYQEGDVWNPYYPKFGVVDCLNCTCKVANNGKDFI